MSSSDQGESDPFVAVRDFLFGLRNRGSKYGISRMVRFAAAAGNPERRFASIHVAGTNGKGSVCALVESALRAGGYRTGLYTSPHLVHLGERIQIGRQPMAEAEISGLAERLRELAGGLPGEGDGEYPSFFEFMTLMAFVRFAELEVDCGILEVGLGGRLDATNIVRPEITAITSIGLDHTEILGDTIEKIAWEKAGILKPGIPVVLGRLPSKAESVIRSRAAELDCPVSSVVERFSSRELPFTNLVGEYQRWNAGVAQLILEGVRDRFPLDSRAIDCGFREVRWAGRWEDQNIGGRRIIFDCTHNPEGAVELAKNLRTEIGPPSGAMDIIVGSLGETRAKAVLRIVAPYARRIFLVRPSQPRALDFSEMRAIMPDDFGGEVLESSVEALFPGGDVSGLPDGPDPVLLTGSIYLLGEVLARVQVNSARTVSLQDRICGF